MDDYSPLQLRLMKIRDERCGGNAAELARRIKKDPTYVNRLFYPPGKRGAKGIGLEIMAACNEAFGLPAGYWDGAELPAATQDDADDLTIRQYSTGGAMGRGLVLRDQPGEIHSWRVTPEWIQKNVHHFTAARNLAIVTGFGDSMRPMYNPGDPLLVDRGVTSVEFDGIYFFRIENEGFIKRLQRIPGVGLRAISENKAYESWDIREGMDFEVFARVVKVWRGEDF